MIKFENMIRILMVIKDGDYARLIAKCLDMTDCYVSFVLNKMEKRGLIELNLVGRRKIVSLTNNGFKAKKLVLEFKKVFGD